MDLIYHYTTLDIFKRILKQGFILPDRNEPQNKTEIPTVTFSADQEWEQTRFRVGRLPNGQMVLLSKPLLQHFCGDERHPDVQLEEALQSAERDGKVGADNPQANLNRALGRLAAGFG